MLSPRAGLKQLGFPPLGGRCPRGAGEARNVDLEGFQASAFSRFAWAEVGDATRIEWY